MEIKISQISVRDLIEWLCQKAGQAQWDLVGHGHLDPKTKACWVVLVSNKNICIDIKPYFAFHIDQY